MEIFHHCVRAVLCECNKTGLTLSKCKIDNSIDINFDLPINRLAYLYKFGTFNIYFFKKCFLDFASDCPGISAVLERMLSFQLFCSLSNGPGTDIIGLQLAMKELGKTFNQNTFFKIISKYGSWRSSMNALTSTIPMFGKFKLLQCNIMECLSSKAENCLKSADVILMDHAFASPNAHKMKILETLKNLLQLLKTGAYIFFIDTKNKMSYFELLNSYGTFIYGPKGVQVDDMPYYERIAEQIGEEPVRCGKAHFAVWQKTTKTENVMVDSVSLVNVIPAKSSDCDEDVKSFHNFSTSTEDSFKTIDDTSLVNVIQTTQNFRESTICEHKTTSHLNNLAENLSLLTLCEQSSVPKKTNARLIVESRNNTDPNAFSTIKTNETENCETFDKVTPYAEEIKTLLCSLNSLVSKLENFLSSETTSNSTISQHRPASGCSCYNHCHHCCLNKCCYSHCRGLRKFP